MTPSLFSSCRFQEKNNYPGIAKIKQITVCFLTFSVLILILTACTGIEKFEQPANSATGTLSSSQTTGQTFVSRYDGLEAISIFLLPTTSNSGSVNLKVKKSPEDHKFIRSSSIEQKNIKSPGLNSFTFDPIENSGSKNYYFEISMDGDGLLQVGEAPAYVYQNGSMLENQNFTDSQLTFKLTYQSGLAAMGLIKEFFIWLWYLSVSLLILLIPGWALAGYLVRKWGEMRWLERGGIAVSTGVAIYPLILLWTNLVGISLGRFYAWIPIFLGSLWIVWRNRRKLSAFPEIIRKLNLRSHAVSVADVALLIVVLLIIITRFWAVRSLDAPMWGDSYQHSVITQLIVDHGGLFESWMPYAELNSFTYHFGFHSLAAAFHWITNLPSYLSVMWVGQILNIFAVICLYPLALRMNRNPWTGVIALLFAGLLSIVPMFYVNWGRYTQLAGLVILPGLMCLTWITQKYMLPDKRQIMLGGLLFAGLGITHYRIILFIVSWFAVVMIANIFWGNFRKTLIVSLLIGIIGTLLISPWLTKLVTSEFMNWILTLFPAAAIKNAPATPPPVNPLAYLSPVFWILLPVLIGLGLVRRNRGYVLVVVWWIGVYLIANMRLLRLPFTGLDNFTVQISIFFPAALIIGETAGWISETIITKIHLGAFNLGKVKFSSEKIGAAVLLLLVVGLSLWGARRRLWDVQPDKFGLVTRPDITAFKWIKENTDPGDRFLVNSFFAFNNTVIVGSDGGWWLPLLAQRSTTTPPLNYGFEAGFTPDFREYTNRIIQLIEQKGLNDPSVIEELWKRGIRYVYVGQKHGAVNSPQPLLSIEQMINSSYFQPVYHQDGVWIFKLSPPSSYGREIPKCGITFF